MKSDINYRVPGPTTPPLPNEIIGIIVDELRDDTQTLRACSTVSNLFYHFCKRHLYRTINLDTPDKVDGFVLASEDTNLQVLRYTHTLSLGVSGMVSWRYADKLTVVLGIFAKEASIKCLSLKEMKFTLVSGSNLASLIETTGALSRTVSKLKLSDCLFIRREDIESLIRSFPLCKTLRLRRCSWQSTQLAPMFSSLSAHTVSLDGLEITTRRTLSMYDLSAIVERDWLDTTGLKSLTYSVIEHSMATKMFNAVQDCHLENLRISCRYKESYAFVFRRMERVIPHVRSLTIASNGVRAPWLLALFLKTFRALHDLEHLMIVTTEPVNSLETVEFYLGLPHPAPSAGHLSGGELGKKLPYLAKHGMLKVSDPKVGMDWLRS